MSRNSSAATKQHSSNIISIAEARARRDASDDFTAYTAGMREEEPPHIRYMVYGVPALLPGDIIVDAGSIEEVAAFSDFEEAKAYVTARDVWCRKTYPAYVVQDSEGELAVLLTALADGHWTEQTIAEV